jgi:hypothetical protein
MFDTIRGLFRAAVAAVTRRSPDPQQQRRRRGETDKGAIAPWQTMLRRFAKTGAAARGRYAALQPVQETAEPEFVAPASAYDRAALHLSDTLDWLNLWQEQDHWLDQSLDDEFSANQNQSFPQP